MPPFWGGPGGGGAPQPQPPRIEAWCTNELEHFMLMIYHNLQLVGEVGNLCGILARCPL